MQIKKIVNTRYIETVSYQKLIDGYYNVQIRTSSGSVIDNHIETREDAYNLYEKIKNKLNDNIEI